MAIPRVDQALVDMGLAGSLQAARLLVMEGKVYLGEGKVGKASDKVKAGLTLSVRDKSMKYVSRGAFKLEKALEVFHIDPSGLTCLDVGASTGGFTQVLLLRGARLVYAVDVGFGLLDYRLRSDERVVVMEKTNARSLAPQMFDPRPTLGVTDVSFISLRAALPAAFAALHGPDRRFVALVKPQFEAAKDRVGQGGVVRDRQVHREVLAYVAGEMDKLGWTCQGLHFSPITGAEGNIEFLMDLRPRETAGAPVNEDGIARIVDLAWNAHSRDGNLKPQEGSEGPQPL